MGSACVEGCRLCCLRHSVSCNSSSDINDVIWRHKKGWSQARTQTAAGRVGGHDMCGRAVCCGAPSPTGRTKANLSDCLPLPECHPPWFNCWQPCPPPPTPPYQHPPSPTTRHFALSMSTWTHTHTPPHPTPTPSFHPQHPQPRPPLQSPTNHHHRATYPAHLPPTRNCHRPCVSCAGCCCTRTSLPDCEPL